MFTSTVAVSEPTMPSPGTVTLRTPLLMVAAEPKVRPMSLAVIVTAPPERATVKVPVSVWSATSRVAPVSRNPLTESRVRPPVSVAGPRWSSTASALRSMSSGDPKVTLPSTPVTVARPLTATDPSVIARLITPPVLVTTTLPVAVTGPRVSTSPLPLTVVVARGSGDGDGAAGGDPRGCVGQGDGARGREVEVPVGEDQLHVPPVRDSRVRVPWVSPTVPETPEAETVTTVLAPMPCRVTRRSPVRVTPPGTARVTLPPRRRTAR